MDCGCLFNKICGYGYYKKGVYIQVIRSTARRYFRGQQPWASAGGGKLGICLPWKMGRRTKNF